MVRAKWANEESEFDYDLNCIDTGRVVFTYTSEFVDVDETIEFAFTSTGLKE
jgi:hypothetical protein